MLTRSRHCCWKSESDRRPATRAASSSVISAKIGTSRPPVSMATLTVLPFAKLLLGKAFMHTVPHPTTAAPGPTTHRDSNVVRETRAPSHTVAPTRVEWYTPLLTVAPSTWCELDANDPKVQLSPNVHPLTKAGSKSSATRRPVHDELGRHELPVRSRTSISVGVRLRVPVGGQTRSIFVLFCCCRCLPLQRWSLCAEAATAPVSQNIIFSFCTRKWSVPNSSKAHADTAVIVNRLSTATHATSCKMHGLDIASPSRRKVVQCYCVAS